MKQKTSWRSVAAMLAASLVVGSAWSQRVEERDLRYALELLADAGMSADEGTIERVVRDEIETVVWVEGRVQGLPVFFRSVGYVFDTDGKMETVLGDRLPETTAAADDEPAINADRAKEIFLGIDWGPAGRVDANALDAVLGLYDGLQEAPYDLTWRVRHHGDVPTALIDASSGEVVFTDSGIRCITVPCP